MNTGEIFLEHINSKIRDEDRENREYQNFINEYIKEQMKNDNLNVIVGFKEILSNEVEQYGDVVKQFNIADAVLLNTKKEFIKSILNITSVKFVEPDFPFSLIKPFIHEEKAMDSNKNWNMKLIGAPYAWDMKASGKGVRLGIIDTGIDYNHPCLKDNIKGGYNFADKTKDPFDDNGHGTHCAGIAASHSSPEENLLGVATGADLYALKVLSATGGGRTSSIIEAIDWAVKENLHIISMSLGSRFPSSSFHEAIIAAKERGMIIVAAAGNEVIGPSFPAFYSEVVSVGAVDKNKNPASFTNRDFRVNIAAPGVQVYSSVPGGKYASYSGTSMACPHISGVFASILGERSMYNDEAENLLYETSEDIKRSSFEVGRGLVRLDNALKRL